MHRTCKSPTGQKERHEVYVARIRTQEHRQAVAEESSASDESSHLEDREPFLLDHPVGVLCDFIFSHEVEDLTYKQVLSSYIWSDA